MNDFQQHISSAQILHVQQMWEGFEIVLGFESRNKYKILDENLNPVAFAAEQSTGLMGTILRQVVGHWRSFNVIIFNEKREKTYLLEFPFRWFFKTLYLKDLEGREIGHLQEKFAIFRKKFDVHDKNGRIVAKINSSFFKFWTFEFFDGHKSLGKIQKKWSGVLGEIFTDKDNFVITYNDPALNHDVKALMLATCLMVDIIYFENNQGRKSLLD
ncbi:MAG: phospholipid scramblase family protein [Bacteriovoracaceae bacterium]|nr:phospholipid scramblase family protein [Bacteriovoracaceae bacterium]